MFVMLLAGATLVHAADRLSNEEMAKIAKAMPNYRMALKSENVGVRQSAVYHLAQLKSRYPGLDLSGFQGELKKLETRDSNAIVRIHAGLTRLYLTDERLAKQIKVEDPDSSVAFYNQVHEMLAAISENPQ